MVKRMADVFGRVAGVLALFGALAVPAAFGDTGSGGTTTTASCAGAASGCRERTCLLHDCCVYDSSIPGCKCVDHADPNKVEACAVVAVE